MADIVHQDPHRDTKQGDASEQMSNNKPQIHPSFAFPDTDIILRSSDNIQFQVHTLILRTTCGFFRDMFEIAHSTSQMEEISMEETGVVLANFFKIIYCMEIKPWGSRSDITELLHVAEKYKAYGAISVVRLTISLPLFADAPLELFDIASHFDWEDEMEMASKLTLSLDLHDEIHYPILNKIPSKSLIYLFNFHEQRKRAFRRMVSSTSEHMFKDWNCSSRFSCLSCLRIVDIRSVPGCYDSWQDLRFRMLGEMEIRPLGDTLLGQASKWPEGATLWASLCPSCRARISPVPNFLIRLQNCIDALPTTLPRTK